MARHDPQTALQDVRRGGTIAAAGVELDSCPGGYQREVTTTTRRSVMWKHAVR
jgi:hypothetical protein